MEVQDRYQALTRASARKALLQPSPRLRPLNSGLDQPLTNLPRTADSEGSLLHLVDLRRRYREEAVTMGDRLVTLQVALEDSSRQLLYSLTSGQATAGKLRAHCDDLVVAVEEAERDLADAHLAIEGVGHEITTLVATRQRAT